MEPETALRIWAKVQAANADKDQGEQLAIFAETVVAGGYRKVVRDERAQVAERLAALDAEIAALE